MSTAAPLPRLAGLMELFFPSGARCVSCREKLARAEEAPLCAACADALRALPADAPCPCCGRGGGARGCLACAGEPVQGLDALLHAYAHEGTARNLVHALKYRGIRDTVPFLAAGMAEALFPQSGDWDVLAPIPLHARRQRTRGFNQAAVLCDALGDASGLPARALLLRIVDTAQQASLGAEERLANVHGAFVSPGRLDGLRVLLVDDVRTTGATAAAAARACKDAGATRVGLISATSAAQVLAVL